MRKTALILVTLLLLHIDSGAVSYKKHDSIIKKAVSAHRRLEKSAGWRVIGKSNWNNSIICREFGSGERSVLIIGGMHGDEPAGVLAVVKLAEFLTRNPEAIRNRAVLIPCLNPDGLRIGRRTNGHKVDINRNFPSCTWCPDYKKVYNNPGPEPASEPETITAIEAMDSCLPSMIIQMHQPFGALYPDRNTPPDLITRMSGMSGFSVSYDIGYSTPGSLGSFKSQQEYKIFGITYELGRIDREPDYDAVISSLIEAINYPY